MVWQSSDAGNLLIVVTAICYAAGLVFLAWYGIIVGPCRQRLGEAQRHTSRMFELTHGRRAPDIGGFLRDEVHKYYQDHKPGILRRSPPLDYLVRTRGAVLFVLGTLGFLALLYAKGVLRPAWEAVGFPAPAGQPLHPGAAQVGAAGRQRGRRGPVRNALIPQDLIAPVDTPTPRVLIMVGGPGRSAGTREFPNTLHGFNMEAWV